MTPTPTQRLILQLGESVDGQTRLLWLLSVAIVVLVVVVLAQTWSTSTRRGRRLLEIRDALDRFERSPLSVGVRKSSGHSHSHAPTDPSPSAVSLSEFLDDVRTLTAPETEADRWWRRRWD